MVLVLEDGTESCMKLVVDLLVHMAQITVLTQDQIDRGFLRVYGDMTEIVLDNPHAYSTLAKLVESCLATGLLSQQLAVQIPQRQATWLPPILYTS